MTFLDTNICLDLLAMRSPWHSEAEILVDWHIRNSVRMGISVLSVSTLAYLLKRDHQFVKINEALNDLVEFTELLGLTEQMTKNALKKGWGDIEDAMQYECAWLNHSNCIITRNKKDFSKSELPVYSPDEWIVDFLDG